jgi:septal ring factor EnvC (AmiA/AmiB activator)
MAREPADATLRLLREIRATQEGHSDLLKQNTEELQHLRKEIHDWQETTATAVGFAAHANVRHEAVEKPLDDLTKRIERLGKKK